jgi:hypothetical protein
MSLPNNLKIDPEISKLVDNMFSNLHNYTAPDPIQSVLIIDLRDSADVYKIRLDCEKLTKYGLDISTFGLNKYCRTEPKYVTGFTTYDFINIPFNSFEYSHKTLDKLIDTYNEIWLIGYNSKDPMTIKTQYYNGNTSVIAKNNMNADVYDPSSILPGDEATSAYITNTLTDKLANIISQFM